MPVLPDGELAPVDGLLPPSAKAIANRELSLYVHVPFCSVRCGYCDFNTYTAQELGSGVSQDTYHLDARREIRFAASVLEASHIAPRKLSTVFFGGGTPTRLAVSDLIKILVTAREVFGFNDNVEITTEANPDSVAAGDLYALADAGFTRVSFGMQSAVKRVLDTLERTHQPSNVATVVNWAKEAGLSVSVDLIYGTPGESLNDWKYSLDEAISYEPDHISAYSLVIEPGTKMAAAVRKGHIKDADPDDQAEKYELADRLLGKAGYQWYEISNWSRAAHGRTAAENQSRHNMAYWRNQDWWGIGPGAHSHIGGVRWWNRKHPLPYARAVQAGNSPALGREILDESTQQFETIMLQIRTSDGLPLEVLPATSRQRIAAFVAEGLLDGRKALAGKAVLTLKGRLLADAVVRQLVP